jgi:hypothetical protein
MYAADDWKTDEMVRAERGLDDAAEQAYRDMYKVDDVLDEIAANEERRAAEHAEACREYAHREDVSPGWRDVIAKVEAGELSWQDVASGAAMDDPAVLTAIVGDKRLREAAVGMPARSDDDYYEEFRVYRKK